MVKLGAVEKWNNLNPRTPPIPEIALPNTAAASKPKTCRTPWSAKPEPNWRSIRPAVSIASPALHNAKVTAPAKLLSPKRLAAIVPAAAPVAPGHLVRGPRAMRPPAATPDAGQNTATPSGFVSRERLSRAARKYTIQTAIASAIELAHCHVGSATGKGRSPSAGRVR